MMLRVLVVLTLLTELAAADLGPIGVYGEASASIGQTWGEMRYPNGVEDLDGQLLGGRLSLGVVLGGATGHNVRVGATLDLFASSASKGVGTAIGIESQADWPVGGCWRIGGRLAISNGTTAETTGDSGVLIAGFRARRGAGILGIDSVFVRPRFYDGYINGILVTAGAGIGGRGRRGRSALAIAGGGALVVMVVGVIAFSVSGCCGR